MNVLIDNQNIKDIFDITVLDYTGILSVAAERENQRMWQDKSGIDKNLENIRYNAREFTINCLIEADNEVIAYNKALALTTYMYTKGVFVLSLRDSVLDVREAFLCQRSGTLVADINIRSQNSLFVFKLGLQDINPNALKFYNTVAANTTVINYTKGRTADIYWGNGDRDIVSNSGDYTKSDYADNGVVDIIVDIDANASIVSPLEAAFSANLTSGAKILDVVFTDASIGSVEIWSWDFGDGATSDLQNPAHSYADEGVYTVTLQVFNSAGGADSEIKTDYITVSNSTIIVNNAGDSLLINATDKLLIN